ncbi:MAG TPA: anthranilate synthase component I family protein, partial [Planctomycetota bacterium]|nr:anthranilate synthase component I family protein [Planctomycetota bacterium]
AARRVDELTAQLCHADVGADILLTDLKSVPPLSYESNVTQEQFEAGVRHAKEFIKAGDIIQVVLSQRLAAKTQAKPFTIYRALRAVNPSPYMVLMQLPGDRYVIGASPEMMVRVEGRTIETRPIAGTRRRGATEDEDARLAAELAADPKELAEHTMLLDLGRNDVGRVAEYGSVKIAKPYSIEYYSHVMHIVSGVEGRLKAGLTAFDVLRSCLPAGTLSGAPKVRAMQIIDEIEPDARGPYGGAVGYFDGSGNHDSCIAIRTLVGVGDTIYVQSGAGIVADSDPASEYQETLAKAKAMLSAVALAEKWVAS